MSNHTTVTEFLLLGFSNIRELQILHFVVFLVLYLAALMGNLLTVTAIVLDHRLHTPMYFFLANLAVLDIGCISSVVPKSMANSLSNTTLISYSGCVTQVFFLLFSVGADVFLLTIMAYDRYVAICRPLHYERVMNWRACVQMATSVWVGGVLNSTLHTGNIYTMSFCHGHVVDQFFCEIPRLLKLACSDSYRTENGLIVLSICLLLICLVFTFVSYVQIFKAVLRIPSEQGRRKAFSTCLPHLIVMSVLIGTGSFSYLKPISSSISRLDLISAVAYSVVPPMLNPVIYSMRNKELKASLRKLTRWRLFPKNKKSMSL
ncbi:olfactory receptor 14A16-like [Pelodiscus sinensis]|uniref:olfactory receptor 14A16-like n=1 Tax=Pelodiscus sinensis TaxID=13735 RepID=UPI003F6D632B